MALDPAVEPLALAHVERTLADSYRREIEQDENVWRSLPFFAATLALQLTTLLQVVDRLPPPAGWAGVTALVLLGLSGAASLVALAFLAASIYPVRLALVLPEGELLAYAWRLIDEERQPRNPAQAKAMNAMVTLTSTLAEQYAAATVQNRRINLRRSRLRSVAGLATVASLVMTLLLVAATFWHYIPEEFRKGAAHVAIGTGSPERAGGASGH